MHDDYEHDYEDEYDYDEAYGRYVVFSYTISLVFISFRRYSEPVLIEPDDSPIMKGMPYTLLTLALGWWGFPFGPIFSVMSLWTNLIKGGEEA